MYNHTTKAWSILNNMPPINRVGHSCEQMPNNPDKFMAVGGTTEKQSATIYDAASDTWASAASTITPRVYARLELIGKRLFAIGGLTTNEQQSYDSVEEYIPDKNVWELKTTKMNIGRHRFGTMALSADLFDSSQLYTPINGGCKGV